MSSVVHYADRLAQMLSKIHGQDLRWTACGWSADDGTRLVITANHESVTCGACKRTIAWRLAWQEAS